MKKQFVRILVTHYILFFSCSHTSQLTGGELSGSQGESPLLRSEVVSTIEEEPPRSKGYQPEIAAHTNDPDVGKTPQWLLLPSELYTQEPSAQTLPDRLAKIFEEMFSQKGLRISQMAEDIKNYHPQLLPFFDFWLVRKLWEKGEFEKASHFVTSLLQADHSELRRYATYLRQQYVQAGSVDRYKIGLIAPPHHLLEIQTALLMAFGVRGSNDPFTVIAVDEPEVVDDLTKALEKLIKEEKVIAIFGGLRVKTRDLIARVTQNYQTPFLYLGQKSGMTQEYPHVFQVGQTLESQVRTVAFDAYKRGIRRFAIIYPNDSYGVEAANLFWDEWVSLGGKITEVVTYHPKETDFQEIAGVLTAKDPTSLKRRQLEYQSIIQDKIKKFPNRRREILSQDAISVLPARFDFEAMFLPDTAMGSGKVLATLAYYGLRRVPAYGTSLWFNPQIKKVSGQIWWDYILIPVTFSHIGSAVEPYFPFVRDFHDRVQKDPTPQAFWAYEGGLILRETIVKKAPQSRQELILALSQSSRVTGILNDQIYFDEFREYVMPVRLLSFDSKGSVFMIR